MTISMEFKMLWMRAGRVFIVMKYQDPDHDNNFFGFCRWRKISTSFVCKTLVKHIVALFLVSSE